MMKWEVTIRGDSTDLGMLAEVLTATELTVIRQDDEYVLRASALDLLNEAAVVREHAKQMVAWLSASARLNLGSHRPIEIGHVTEIREDGSKNTFIHPEPVVARFKVIPGTLSLSSPDGQAVIHRPGDPVRDWVRLAMDDEAIAKALRLRDTAELGWVKLYRMYEVVEGDVGKPCIVQKGWLSNRQIRRFKYTANSVDAAGDAARHGKEATDPPSNPMSLREASTSIDGLLHAWIRWKIGEGSVT